jgi:hypothetical protein
MTGLPEAPGLVKPGEESAEQVAELLLVVLGEMNPQGYRGSGRTRRHRLGQARGGAVRRAVLGIRSLRVIQLDVGDTIQRAQAAPRH